MFVQFGDNSFAIRMRSSKKNFSLFLSSGQLELLHCCDHEKSASLSSQNEIELLGLPFVKFVLFEREERKFLEPPQTDNYPQFIDIRELFERSFDARSFDSRNSFAISLIHFVEDNKLFNSILSKDFAEGKQVFESLQVRKVSKR